MNKNNNDKNNPEYQDSENINQNKNTSYITTKDQLNKLKKEISKADKIYIDIETY